MPGVRKLLKLLFVLGPAVTSVNAAPFGKPMFHRPRNDVYLPAGGLTGADPAAAAAAAAPAPPAEAPAAAMDPAAAQAPPAEAAPPAMETAAAAAAAAYTPPAAAAYTPPAAAAAYTPPAAQSVAAAAAAAETPAAVETPAAAAATPPAAAETPAAAAGNASAAAAGADAGAAAAAAPALSDVDILQFALTAEHLENAFYQQGFAKFPASDFMALGLNDADIKNLQNIGTTEAAHVSTLLSVIASSGTAPVQPCQYEFGFTDAKGMVATARILEAVGISAYLGAAPLITNASTLSAAASIVTVEGRHQTLIRNLAGADAVPAAFDTALGPRAVFTLASQFIKSCPDGSNLNVQAFPAISLGGATSAMAGQSLVLADQAQPSGAKFCAFMSNGGVQFADIANGNCAVPQGLVGETYMMVTSTQGITDNDILAGPSVLTMT